MLAIWLQVAFQASRLRKNQKKEKKGSQKKGSPKKREKGQRLTSLETQPGAKLRRISRGYYFAAACTQRFRLRILRRTRSNAGRTSAGSLSGRIESIWETPSKERGEAHGIGACLESGRNTERACNTAARSCPSSLSKFPGRTWTSGSARGKHVIKLVQVPCPSSCPSSGFRPGPRSWNRGLPGIGA